MRPRLARGVVKQLKLNYEVFIYFRFSRRERLQVRRAKRQRK